MRSLAGIAWNLERVDFGFFVTMNCVSIGTEMDCNVKNKAQNL